MRGELAHGTRSYLFGYSRIVVARKKVGTFACGSFEGPLPDAKVYASGFIPTYCICMIRVFARSGARA